MFPLSTRPSVWSRHGGAGVGPPAYLTHQSKGEQSTDEIEDKSEQRAEKVLAAVFSRQSKTVWFCGSLKSRTAPLLQHRNLQGAISITTWNRRSGKNGSFCSETLGSKYHLLHLLKWWESTMGATPKTSWGKKLIVAPSSPFEQCLCLSNSRAYGADGEHFSIEGRLSFYSIFQGPR